MNTCKNGKPDHGDDCHDHCDDCGCCMTDDVGGVIDYGVCKCESCLSKKDVDRLFDQFDNDEAEAAHR